MSVNKFSHVLSFTSELNAGAESILKTAEKLFAEHGIEAVSTRMISRESGQKNHSALQYHFKTRDKLIEAILDYRLIPLNQKRLLLLKNLKDQNKQYDIAELVRVFFQPFAEELLKPPEESCYVSTLAQLYAYQRGRDLFLKNKSRARAIHEITSLMIKALHPMPLSVIHFRLQLLGRQTMTAIAEWDEARRSEDILLDEEVLRWRIKNFIDYTVAGLKAPVENH